MSENIEPQSSPQNSATMAPLEVSAEPVSVPDQLPADVVVPTSPTSEQSEHVQQPEVASVPEPAVSPSVSMPTSPVADSRSLLVRAMEKIRFRKKAKLEKIMGLAGKKPSIGNDDLEKLLHVSDATATRYLSQLVKEGMLRRVVGGRGSTSRYEAVR